MSFYELKQDKVPRAKKILKRVACGFAVIGFGFFLALSPLALDNTGTGILSRQKAEAAPVCYNGDVIFGESSACQNIEGDKPSGDSCYRRDVPSVSGGGPQNAYYTRIDCPVNPETIADDGPFCRRDNRKVDCNGNTDKGKCYNWSTTTGRNSGGGWRETTCTTVFVPDGETGESGDTKKPNECYDADNKKIDCPDDKKRNQGLCYRQAKQAMASTPGFNRIDCATLTSEIAAGDEEEESCEERMKLSSGWIVCSALELLSDGMDDLLGYVDSLLNVDVVKLDNDAALRTSWSYFRGVATFMLLAVGLVMVIAQAIGKGN